MNTISATKARVHFGEILRRVEDDETFTIERAGEPKAVILSIGKWRQIQNNQSQTESWPERLERTRQRYLQEARDVHYDLDGEIRQMREERDDDLVPDLR